MHFEPPAFAFTTRYWTGAHSDLWSDPKNWNPEGTPQNGEGLHFDDSHNPDHTSMVNDLVGLDVALHFASTDFSLEGNEITISGEFDVFDCSLTINCPLRTRGLDAGVYRDAELFLNGGLALGGGQNRFYAGGIPTSGTPDGSGQIHFRQISGDRDLLAFAQTDDSSIEFGGDTANAFTGTLTIHTLGDSQIAFSKPAGKVVCKSLSVIDGHVAKLNLHSEEQIDDHGTITLEHGSQLLLMGNNETIGSLVVTNVRADTSACILDTGNNLLSLNDAIIAHGVYNPDHIHPIIKGRLNPNGLLTMGCERQRGSLSGNQR